MQQLGVEIMHTDLASMGIVGLIHAAHIRVLDL